MNKMLLLIPVLFLAGCNTTTQTIVKTEQVVFIPEKSLFSCPSTKLPNPENLTDAQVAKVIVNLHNNNKNCQRNMNTILNTLEEAKKTTEQPAQ